MKIHQFSQQGKRSNNEDSLGHSAGLITVCDGIGGHVSGERASAFVVEAMTKAFQEPAAIGKMEIQQQLNQVQSGINQLLDKEPELEKMGTTFTGIFRTPDVWFAAHIGDSRIYLFRPSERKLWHTWDHSLVGELMRTKEITVEAGRFHPMSNRIEKAIIAQRDGKPANASIVRIDQLKPGDVFLLCSDGVIEAWGDLELVKLFSDTSRSFEDKCKALQQQCDQRSKDNNTAIIVEVEEADAFNYGDNDELTWTTFDEVEADFKQYLKDSGAATEIAVEEEKAKPEPGMEKEKKPQVGRPISPVRKDKPKNARRWLFLIGAVLLVLALALFLLLRRGKSSENDAVAEPENAKVEQAEPTKEKAESKTKLQLQPQPKPQPKPQPQTNPQPESQSESQPSSLLLEGMSSSLLAF